MIVISGSARTGTSLMIQTLLLLGLDTPAKKFIPEHDNILKYNKKGFYEMYEQVINGVDHDKWKGQAVKLFPSSLSQTNKHHISKLIICCRDKKDAIKSYKPIHKNLGGDLTPEEAYDRGYEFLDKYIVGVSHIFINFEEINSNSLNVILRLCDFLDISPTLKQIKEAIKNIDHGNLSSRSNRSRSFRLPNVSRS